MSDPQPGWAELEPSSAFTESASHDAIYADLVPAFGELANVATDQEATVPTKSGGSYSYKYMSLGAIMAATRVPLATHNLAIMQAPTILQDGGGRSVEISTRLIHTSGEWIETRIAIAVAAGADAQAIGSAMTYARRYGLTALLGIASGDDDDARAASQSPPGDYEKMPIASMDLANAKGYVLEHFDGNAPLALRFWSEMIGPVNKGPFVPESIAAMCANIDIWRAAQTIDVNDDETAPDAASGDQPAEGAQTPQDGDAAAQTAPEGVDRAARARAEVAAEVAEHAGLDVDAIVAEVQAMSVPDVRLKLSEQLMDSRGNADTIRKRYAEQMIRDRTEALRAAAADDSPFTDDESESAEDVPITSPADGDASTAAE